MESVPTCQPSVKHCHRSLVRFPALVWYPTGLSQACIIQILITSPALSSSATATESAGKMATMKAGKMATMAMKKKVKKSTTREPSRAAGLTEVLDRNTDWDNYSLSYYVHLSKMSGFSLVHPTSHLFVVDRTQRLNSWSVVVDLQAKYPSARNRTNTQRTPEVTCSVSWLGKGILWIPGSWLPTITQLIYPFSFRHSSAVYKEVDLLVVHPRWW